MEVSAFWRAVKYYPVAMCNAIKFNQDCRFLRMSVKSCMLLPTHITTLLGKTRPFLS